MSFICKLRTVQLERTNIVFNSLEKIILNYLDIFKIFIFNGILSIIYFKVGSFSIITLNYFNKIKRTSFEPNLRILLTLVLQK